MDVIQQDIGATLQFTILKDGALMDLTNATVTLMLSNGATYACVVQTPAINGIATHTTTANEFAQGLFQGVLKVVQGALTLYSSPFPFNVKALFA